MSFVKVYGFLNLPLCLDDEPAYTTGILFCAHQCIKFNVPFTYCE